MKEKYDCFNLLTFALNDFTNSNPNYKVREDMPSGFLISPHCGYPEIICKGVDICNVDFQRMSMFDCVFTSVDTVKLTLKEDRTKTVYMRFE